MQSKIYWLLQDISNNSAWVLYGNRGVTIFVRTEDNGGYLLTHPWRYSPWTWKFFWKFWSAVAPQAQIHWCKSPGNSDHSHVQLCVSTIKRRCQWSPRRIRHRKDLYSKTFQCFRISAIYSSPKGVTRKDLVKTEASAEMKKWWETLGRPAGNKNIDSLSPQKHSSFHVLLAAQKNQY